MAVVKQRRSSGRGLSRETLLAVAAHQFAERSYRATTLDDIAHELGLQKASLYHYIRSKEDLLTAIYSEIFDRIEAAVAPTAQLDLSADERLRRMVHGHVQVVAAELNMLAVSFQEESELSEDTQDLIRRRKRGYERLFEGVVAEGQRDGVFRPGSPRLMVMALLGMCNWMYKWFGGAKWSAEEVAAEFALTVESGIRVGGPTRSAWPRYGSVADAMGETHQALARARAELDRLESELLGAEERLHDGLAMTKPVVLSSAVRSPKTARK